MKVTKFQPGGIASVIQGAFTGTVAQASNAIALGGLAPINAAASNYHLVAISSNQGVWRLDDSGVVSYGSNSTDVSGATIGGASLLVAREDHRHAGIYSITSSSSNTLERPVVNLRPGAGVAFGLTDTNGNGSFDTLTISSSASGGGGGSSPTTDAAGTLAQSIAWTTVANAGTKTFGSTPTNGNTIYAFVVTNIQKVTSLVQTNVTWTNVAKMWLDSGNNMILEIWKGVVAASASTTVTFNFDGNNVQAVILQEWSGLTTVDIAQGCINRSPSVYRMENHHIAWTTPGGRAFLLWGNATGGGPTTPTGWTASTGTPFNYGGSGNGSLYTIDASATSSAAATTSLVPVANDNICAILMHAKP